MTRLRRLFFQRAARNVALMLAASVGLAWIGMDRWYDYHLPLVTGSADIGRHSCLYCHDNPSLPAYADVISGPGYLSPSGLVVAPDGDTLYIAAHGADQLLVFDTASGEVMRSLPLAGRPHDVAISRDGATLAVTCSETDEVHLLDAATLEITETRATGREPFGVALGDAGAGGIFVADGGSQTVSLLPMTVEDGLGTIRLSAGLQPYAVDLSDDGRLLAVANRLARAPTPLEVPTSEITLIDPVGGRVTDRRVLSSAHMSEGVAVASDGSFVLASIIRVRNLIPITQVSRGALMNSAVAFVDTRPGGRVTQFPLDTVNTYFSDPSGVVLTPDDRLAFVAASGADVVTVLDVEAMRAVVAGADDRALDDLADDLGAHEKYVLARIPTGANPRAMAMAPDGRFVYVAERLDDTIAVIDTSELRVTRRIDLGGPKEMTPERRGERVFASAARTFQGQFSCRSCHPDGHSDGVTYDFVIDGIARNRLESRSLRGIRDTAPFKWNGKNVDLATQCGPRFALVLTMSDPFTPDELSDLVAYIESIPLPARRVDDAVAEAVERGRELFVRRRTKDGTGIPRGLRCPTCHRGALFTDRLMRDVASQGPNDSSDRFDTPHLLDIRSSAPYMHDGRAWSLEELWTVYNPDDTHGMTNDLSKIELNDLVLYLRSL